MNTEAVIRNARSEKKKEILSSIDNLIRCTRTDPDNELKAGMIHGFKIARESIRKS